MNSSFEPFEPATLLAEFAKLPLKPPRSKLEPHRELIRELRRKGRTYREVSRLFADRLGLQVAPSVPKNSLEDTVTTIRASKSERPLPLELREHLDKSQRTFDRVFRRRTSHVRIQASF